MPLQTSSHTLPFHNALQLSTLRSYYCPNSQLAFQHPSQLHQPDITMIIIITFELLTSLPISLNLSNTGGFTIIRFLHLKPSNQTD